MNNTYIITFMVGEDLTTHSVTAANPQEAASKVGTQVIGITVPGYKVVKDDDHE